MIAAPTDRFLTSKEDKRRPSEQKALDLWMTYRVEMRKMYEKATIEDEDVETYRRDINTLNLLEAMRYVFDAAAAYDKHEDVEYLKNRCLQYLMTERSPQFVKPAFAKSGGAEIPEAQSVKNNIQLNFLR
jgi:hypothetical protein